MTEDSVKPPRRLRPTEAKNFVWTEHAFFEPLRTGVLKPLHEALLADDTLHLALRESYVSIYYRGGQLFKLSQSKAKFKVTFDMDYDKETREGKRLADRLTRMQRPEVLGRAIECREDCERLVDAIPELKRTMDPVVGRKHEREFQQVVARENNRMSGAGESHYFITDVEHADGKARFDMLGVRWASADRKRGERLVPTLFEMKFGGGASLTGETSGLVKHFNDMVACLAQPGWLKRKAEMIASQFNLLAALELVSFNRSASIRSFSCVDGQVGIVFVLAGYNPGSSELAPVLEALVRTYEDAATMLEQQGITLQVYVFRASFCGYGMYDKTMISLVDAHKQLLGEPRSGT